MNGGTAIELSAPVLFLTFLLLQLKQALLLFLSFLPAQHLALCFHLLVLQAQCLLGFCSNSHILNLAPGFPLHSLGACRTHPLEIAAQEYAANSTLCMMMCALWLPLLFVGTIHVINRSDLEGGMR